jgi:hypothetical protein
VDNVDNFPQGSAATAETTPYFSGEFLKRIEIANFHHILAHTIRARPDEENWFGDWRTFELQKAFPPICPAKRPVDRSPRES